MSVTHYTHATHMLHTCYTIPCVCYCYTLYLLHVVDDKYYAKYWHLIDRLVQQVVLQQSDGTDPDVTPLKIDVDNLVQQ